MLRPGVEKTERYLLFYRYLAQFAHEVGAETPFEKLRMVRRVVTLTNGGHVGAAIDYLSERMRRERRSQVEIHRAMSMLLPYFYQGIGETPPAPEY